MTQSIAGGDWLHTREKGEGRGGVRRGKGNEEGREGEGEKREGREEKEIKGRREGRI